MRNWTMPVIKVDRFEADEYVAACYQMVTNLTGTIHWDFNHDGIYNEGRGEDVTPRTQDDLYNLRGSTPQGWYLAEDFWKDSDHFALGREGRGYNDTTFIFGQPLFTYINKYVVYVFGNGTIGIYRGDMNTSGRTPTPNHLFS